jgi:membrane protein
VTTPTSPTGSLATTWTLFTSAVGVWLERNAFVHAGSLAFYTLFSMAPIFIIAVSIAGAIFGEEAARGEVVTALNDFIGEDAALAVEDAVARSRPEVAGLFPTIAGIVALLLGATTVFAQMQISLNRIWGVVAKPHRSGIFLMAKNRLLSLTIVLTIGFVLLVSLLLNVAVQGVVAYARSWVPVPGPVLTGAELLLSFVSITLLFAVIYKVLPDAVVDWRDVWFGAGATAVLFIIGRYGIAFYLTYTAPNSSYGAAGSLVLLLMWVYYSSLILFFGAALTKARHLASGRDVVPKITAVRVREELVEERA